MKSCRCSAGRFAVSRLEASCAEASLLQLSVGSVYATAERSVSFCRVVDDLEERFSSAARAASERSCCWVVLLSSRVELAGSLQDRHVELSSVPG